MMNAPVSRPFHSFAQAFLSEAAAGHLVYAKCAVCSRTLGYTRRLCVCGSGLFVWHTASSAGRIISHVTYRRAYSESFPPPYTVVRVALAEGPRLSAWWTATAGPATGAAVHLGFDEHSRLSASPI